MPTIFDSHCHTFNGSILQDLLHPATKMPQGIKPESKVGQWWNYMKETAAVLVNSQEENNKFVRTALANAYPHEDNYATVPLMMDINYLHNEPFFLNDVAPAGDLTFESNILNQINGLMDLSFKGNCYPFFCVDPRRVGIIDAILDGRYITKRRGGFFGLKLYPRLGYHPMSGRLPEIYAYCANNRIPITTHCSATGFPPWSTPQFVIDFGDPENFRPALEKNNDLIIDFAHWGWAGDTWGKSIIDMMNKYPNVYSDLSCYTGDHDLAVFRKGYWDIDIVRERTIYGSDFDVFYFTETGMDINEYIQSFKDVFTEDDMNNMMATVPPKFLGL